MAIFKKTLKKNSTPASGVIPVKLSYVGDIVSVNRDAIIRNSNKILSAALKGDFKKGK